MTLLEVPNRMAISLDEIGTSELSKMSKISRERVSNAAKQFLRIQGRLKLMCGQLK
jgi:hypothetical protein